MNADHVGYINKTGIDMFPSALMFLTPELLTELTDMLQEIKML
jgi:hypothetical protein